MAILAKGEIFQSVTRKLNERILRDIHKCFEFPDDACTIPMN